MENYTVRVAGAVNDSIVDGPGFRYTLFVQGCPHGCRGCHNPQTHDFSGGEDRTVEEIFEQIMSNPMLDGVTLSGGEPFCQANALAELAKKVHEQDLNVITYTGYEYEYLLSHSTPENGYMKLLNETDFLVDGPFIIERKNLLLKFRGSDNQRIIDVKRSMEQGSIALSEMLTN